MAKQEFALGDKVQHLTGGPILVVIGFGKDIRGMPVDRLNVSWWDGETHTFKDTYLCTCAVKPCSS